VSGEAGPREGSGLIDAGELLAELASDPTLAPDFDALAALRDIARQDCDDQGDPDAPLPELEAFGEEALAGALKLCASKARAVLGWLGDRAGLEQHSLVVDRTQLQRVSTPALEAELVRRFAELASDQDASENERELRKLTTATQLDEELGARFDALMAQLPAGETVFYLRNPRKGARGWYRGKIDLSFLASIGPHRTPELAAVEGVLARGSSS
jgi:hypothetical protein